MDTLRKLARGREQPLFKNARFLDTMTMIPITYGYARVSKADDDSKNLETQLRELDAHGIRRDLNQSQGGMCISGGLEDGREDSTAPHMTL